MSLQGIENLFIFIMLCRPKIVCRLQYVENGDRAAEQGKADKADMAWSGNNLFNTTPKRL